MLLQGRIRGTYGINAKPLEVQTPAESPPAPGVTRASLRPKPVAKASPDDEQSEGAKPAAPALRPARVSLGSRAVTGGPDGVGAVPGSPGSPHHSKGSMLEGESNAVAKFRLQHIHLNNCSQKLLTLVVIKCFLYRGLYNTSCVGGRTTHSTLISWSNL